MLVGVSGVEKTQIIRLILGLKGIANGKSFNGVYTNYHALILYFSYTSTVQYLPKFKVCF
ncbi:hypothetical protein AFK68_03260 [Hydrocoleum sp. CS-953]|nr:hypothetical protein AFK68_03260 [Hydrocoleum sp. CS-953]